MVTGLTVTCLGQGGLFHVGESIVSVRNGGLVSFNPPDLRAEILELFEDVNQAEERELQAYYVVNRLKHSRKSDGKFGKVRPVFFKPTISGAQLRAIHSDLNKLSLRKCGRSSYEQRKLTRYRRKAA